MLGLISMHLRELEGRRRKSQVLGLICEGILAPGGVLSGVAHIESTAEEEDNVRMFSNCSLNFM